MITNPSVRKWHEANPEKLKAALKRYREKRIQWLRELKKTLICLNCGENRWYVLDFHHRNPEEKESGIAAFLHRHSIKDVLAEIAKCDVLCANCHREEHAKLKGWL